MPHRHAIHRLLLVGLLASALPGLAAPAITPQMFEEMAQSITGQAELPVETLKVLERNGQLFFVSGNGRYLFRGELYDTWTQAPIDTLQQARQSVSRVPLDKMGVQISELFALRLGEGPHQVVFFTDPQCSHCHALADEARALGAQYTFWLVPVPALGDESNRLVRRLACARDPDQQLAALLNGTIDDLATLERCPEAAYTRNLLTATRIGVDGIPYLIAADGRVSRGRPGNFALWLAGEAH